MKRLPYGDAASLDVRKFTDYCLSPTHPRGRHKARVFRSTLGIEARDALELRDRILEAARDGIAEKLDSDSWGDRWQLDVIVVRQGRRAVVRTLWIVRAGEQSPRFVTCWVV